MKRGCCLIFSILILLFFSLLIIVMDGLTHGGLFKNDFWQSLRKLWWD